MDKLILRAPSSPLDWLRIRLLYRQAFPRYERKPFAIIRRMFREGRTDVWMAFQQGRFAGMAATINGGDAILLDYFAVQRALRGQGVGSAFLQALLEKYAGKGLFVEIEAADRDAPTARRPAARPSTCATGSRTCRSSPFCSACGWSCWAGAVPSISTATAPFIMTTTTPGRRSMSSAQKTEEVRPCC